MRSRRWPETPDKHVRLVPLAPTLAVAQWQSGGLWPRPREFDSLRSPHFVRLAAGRGQTIAAESWGPRTAAQSVGRSVSGKPPVFEAGFECSIHSLPAIAGSFSGRTLLSDSRCRWVRVHPRQPFFCGRIVQRKGHRATNPEITVQLCMCLPIGHSSNADRTRLSESRNSGSNPEWPTRKNTPPVEHELFDDNNDPAWNYLLPLALCLDAY